MNDTGYVLIAAWQTGSKKRQQKAETYCKDYGFSKIQKSVHAGLLYGKERSEFKKKIANLFIGKRDRVHFFVSCRSCLKIANIKELVIEDIPFEIIQEPKNN